MQTEFQETVQRNRESLIARLERRLASDNYVERIQHDVIREQLARVQGTPLPAWVRAA